VREDGVLRAYEPVPGSAAAGRPHAVEDRGHISPLERLPARRRDLPDRAAE
jgi:hypothetical protein